MLCASFPDRRDVVALFLSRACLQGSDSSRRQVWTHALLAVRLLSVLMVGLASGELETCHTGSASATAWTPYSLLVVLVFAGVVIGFVIGGGVILHALRHESWLSVTYYSIYLLASMLMLQEAFS